MKPLLAIIAIALMSCATDPDTICFDDEFEASHFFGTGQYTKYRDEFEKKNNCEGLIGCAGKTMVVHRCVDNVEFK